MKKIALLPTLFIVLTVQGQSWVKVWKHNTETWTSYKAVALTSASKGIAVGENGSIYQFQYNENRIWGERVFSGVEDALNAVSFPQPTIGFIGSGKGLVLRTENGGDSWKTIAKVNQFGFESIAFTDINNGVGVSRYGAIVLTDDGGKTWAKVYDDNLNHFSKVYFVNKLVGYAVGTKLVGKEKDFQVLVLATNDGGRSWFSTIQENNMKIRRLVSKSRNVERDGESYLETNYDSDFVSEKLSKGNYFGWVKDIKFYGNYGIAVGQNFILKTLNGGSSWFYCPLESEDKKVFTHVTFTNSGKLIGAGEEQGTGRASIAFAEPATTYWAKSTYMKASAFNDIITTEDNMLIAVGESTGIVLINESITAAYTTQIHAAELKKEDPVLFPKILFGIDLYSPSDIVAVGTFDDDQGLQRAVILTSVDGGINWLTESFNGMKGLRAFQFIDNEGVAVGTEGKAIFLAGEGEFFNPTSLISKDLILRDVKYVKGKGAYLVGERGFFMKMSDDGGRDNRTLNLHPDSTLANIGITTDGKIFVSTDNGLLFCSKDDGNSFSICNTGTTSKLRGIAFVDDLIGVVVGANGTILRTTDGGSTWKEVYSGTKYFLSSVAFRNKTQGYAVGEGGIILETNDKGEHWKEAGGYYGDWFNRIVFFDENTGFIVGDRTTILKFMPQKN